jgi:hypothetical protein
MKKLVAKAAKKVISIEMPKDVYNDFLKWQNQFETPTVEDIRDIKKAEMDFKKGNYMTHDQLYKKLFGKSPTYATL